MRDFLIFIGCAVLTIPLVWIARFLLKSIRFGYYLMAQYETDRADRANLVRELRLAYEKMDALNNSLVETRRRADAWEAQYFYVSQKLSDHR